MNTLKLLFFRIIPAILFCIQIGACVPGYGITEPYTAPIEREKENIYYVPASPNTPLATEKNDLTFNLTHSSGTRFSGVDLQASYLPSKHVGIIGGYSSVKNRGGSPDYMKYKRFELGAGYITRLSPTWHFETYAGGGKGNVNNFHYSGSSKVSTTNFFVQPAIAFNNHRKSFTFGIVSRFSGVNFSVRDSLFDTDREPFNKAQLESLYDQPFHVMWEPGLIIRSGWKNFKFHAGYSIAADLTDPELNMSKNNFSLGISMQFQTVNK